MRYVIEQEFTKRHDARDVHVSTCKYTNTYTHIGYLRVMFTGYLATLTGDIYRVFGNTYGGCLPAFRVELSLRLGIILVSSELMSLNIPYRGTLYIRVCTESAIHESADKQFN